MDTTLPDSGKELISPSSSELKQALQTYPKWSLHCSELPVVLEALDSGLTNSCYVIKADGQRFVLRLNAKNSRVMGLDRVNEQVALRHAEKAGLGAKVVYCAPTEGLLVTEVIEGRHWSITESQTEQNIDRLAQLLKRVHTLPGTGKRFVPEEVVGRYLSGIQLKFVVIPERFKALKGSMDRIMLELTEGGAKRCLCHHDPVLSNIIDNGKQLFLIDWEYAAMGDPLFDVAVLVHNLQFNEQQMQRLLASYLGSVDTATQRRFLCNYAVYMYIDMLWYWFQSAYAEQQGFGDIAEAKLDTLVAVLHELGC